MSNFAPVPEFVPNPDGCKCFEPHAFKKDKCKSCGRPWYEHKGVIDDAHVKRFTDAIVKAFNDKQKAEEEARQKAKAKQIAKKKQAQAVEDEWLYDGDAAQKAAEESDDDDMGFRMFTPDVSNQQPQQQRPAEPNKTFKVVSLIDFGECDVAEEPAEPEPVAAPVQRVPSGQHFPASMGSSAQAIVPQAAGAEDLHMEIQTLKQMLADANEEKSIQVAIVKDEVVEKQQLIEELTRRNQESQAMVEELRRQTEALRSEQSSAVPAGEVQHWQAEAARLQAQVEDLNRRADEHAVAMQASEAAKAKAEAEAAAAKVELTTARAEVEQARQAEQEARRTATQARAATPAAPASGDVLSSHAEAHAVAQQMGRHAAQALREIRLNAEMQLAWLSKRRLMDGQQLAMDQAASQKEAPLPSS